MSLENVTESHLHPQFASLDSEKVRHEPPGLLQVPIFLLHDSFAAVIIASIEEFVAGLRHLSSVILFKSLVAAEIDQVQV